MVVSREIIDTLYPMYRVCINECISLRVVKERGRGVSNFAIHISMSDTHMIHVSSRGSIIHHRYMCDTCITCIMQWYTTIHGDTYRYIFQWSTAIDTLTIHNYTPRYLYQGDDVGIAWIRRDTV